jgi:delta1-piperideine-2-carboxylate reductase
VKVGIAELTGLVGRALRYGGLSPRNTALVAEVIVAAERDGSRSHGLQRLPGYLSSLASGWVDGKARPTITSPGPGLIHANARNGFAQIALAKANNALRKAAERNGVALLGIQDSHHFAALWPDLEPFAADGFLTVGMLNSRSHIVAWDGKKKSLGTNPMAFACPRKGRPPLIWDQASSLMSQGDVLLHAAAGKALPVGIGVDRRGVPTESPKAVLDGGALLPFGGAKGSSIAFMVEVFAAALTGGRFGFEDESAKFPGAKTSRAGQVILLVSPTRMAGDAFEERIESLLDRMGAAGTKRFPGDLRYERRLKADTEGIEVSAETFSYLKKQASARAQSMPA